MNPIDQLAACRDAAKKSYLTYASLHDALTAALEEVRAAAPTLRLNLEEASPFQINDEGFAVLRWRFMNATVLYLAAEPHSPSTRVWGSGSNVCAPYYEQVTQEKPPAAWLDFARDFFA